MAKLQTNEAGKGGSCEGPVVPDMAELQTNEAGEGGSCEGPVELGL